MYSSWDGFLRTRIILDPGELVDAPTRERLEALPGRLHLRGDAVPLDYEVEGGVGVARVRLREGQARRLRQDELPPLDRPLRFAVQRGTHPPIQADTIPALQSLLQRAPKADGDELCPAPIATEAEVVAAGMVAQRAAGENHGAVPAGSAAFPSPAPAPCSL